MLPFLKIMTGVVSVVRPITGNTGYWLILPTVIITLWAVFSGYRKSRDLFSPLCFFTGFYLLWMVGGYLINYSDRSFHMAAHYRTIPIYILIGYVSFLLGYLIPVIEAKKTISYRVNDREYPVIKKHLYIIYFVAFLFSILYYAMTWRILMSGSIHQTRFQAIAGMGYIYHVMELFYYFFLVYLATKWFFKKSFKLFDWVLLILALLPLLIHFHRGPIIWIIISLISYRHYANRKVNFKKLIVSAAILFCLGAFMGNLREGKKNMSIFLRASNELKVHVWNLSRHMSNSKEIGVPLGPRPVWMAVALLMPGPDLDFSRWLQEKFDYPDIPSITLIGEGYMSFLVWGVILEFFIIGFLLKQVYYLFSKKPSLRNLCIYIFLLTQSCSAITFGINKVLVSTIYFIGLSIILIPRDTILAVDEEEEISIN
jgi:phosphate/sulfate permease